jgi:Xaa-Pro aminopeptidase
VRCDGPVLRDELLLLDMGVEVNSYYTADVTRTFPASGRFSPAQRQVHDLVEKAHRAGLAAVAPGRPFTDFHHAAMEVIAQGLADWGLLPVSVDEALSDEGQHHRRYLVCGIGHHLGLDVHDCARSSEEAYQGGVMAPGMVLTVEPGLYFHAHDLTVPPELRGIGVRIEDDLLVTSEGTEVLSSALPLDADGLEKWMTSTWEM